MAAFPLPLTFDKRMTPPPVGCQGDWPSGPTRLRRDLASGRTRCGAFRWVRFLWSLTFDVVVYAGKSPMAIFYAWDDGGIGKWRRRWLMRSDW